MKRRSYTFNFWTWWPRWRTYSYGPHAPVNWLWFKWYDFAPLVLVLALADPNGSPEVIFALMAAWYFIAFPAVLWRRLRARRRFCESTYGHTAYKPLDEVDEWECVYCGTPLNMADPYVAASAVGQAARSQAYWSDRR